MTTAYLILLGSYINELNAEISACNAQAFCFENGSSTPDEGAYRYYRRAAFRHLLRRQEIERWLATDYYVGR